MTPQALEVVLGESNEINGEKNCLKNWLHRKKLFAFDKVWKKCTFKLGDEKKFDHKGKP